MSAGRAVQVSPSLAPAKRPAAPRYRSNADQIRSYLGHPLPAVFPRIHLASNLKHRQPAFVLFFFFFLPLLHSFLGPAALCVSFFALGLRFLLHL